jgi:hypothetical protein
MRDFFVSCIFEGGPRNHETEAIYRGADAFACRQHEAGTTVEEIIRKLGISEQTFYRWKKKFAGRA